MAAGHKHLIECKCILPQFRRLSSPPFHKFTVYSKFDDNGEVIPKIVQCPNCGVLHRVTDMCTSVILNDREHSNALIGIDDIRGSIPKEIADILDKHDADLATWEQVQDILESDNRWGEFVLLAVENIGSERQGKVLRILGRNIYKVTAFTSNNLVG